MDNNENQIKTIQHLEALLRSADSSTELNYSLSCLHLSSLPAHSPSKARSYSLDVTKDSEVGIGLASSFKHMLLTSNTSLQNVT